MFSGGEWQFVVVISHLVVLGNGSVGTGYSIEIVRFTMQYNKEFKN